MECKHVGPRTMQAFRPARDDDDDDENGDDNDDGDDTLKSSCTQYQQQPYTVYVSQGAIQMTCARATWTGDANVKVVKVRFSTLSNQRGSARREGSTSATARSRSKRNCRLVIGCGLVNVHFGCFSVFSSCPLCTLMKKMS